MDTDDDDTDHPTDLTQLLVIEAGRILEDASPDLASALPVIGAERQASLYGMLKAIEIARTLMIAAIRLEDMTDHSATGRSVAA